MSELNLKKNEVIKGWAKYYLTAEVNSGFERLTAPAFSYGMSAILSKLYKEDEEEYKKALQRHLMFYNSEATWGSVIFGMTCALEEERAIMLQEGAGSEELEASADMISNLKVGLMGPLAGLGDSVRAGTIAPIVTAFCISIGQTGNLIAPFLLEGILVAIVWPFAIWLLKKSYHTGKEGIQEIFSIGKLNWITTMTSTLGGITLGALAASYVTLSSPLEFVLGKGSKIALQADVLDVILKNILPLSMVLLSVYLLNKKVSAVKIILILAAVCALGVLIGIF